MNFVDPDEDPEEEVLIILEMFREIDPEIDMENTKMKEERRNRLSGNGYFGFTFFFSITFVCCRNSVVAKWGFYQYTSHVCMFTSLIYLFSF